MDFEIVLESFERWLKGTQLTTDDTTNIVMGIILVVLLIVLIVMLVIISIQSLFWTRIGWFFEDVWHWLKRRRFVCGKKRKIHPSKYEIKKKAVKD